jgi:hypothetical protein
MSHLIASGIAFENGRRVRVVMPAIAEEPERSEAEIRAEALGELLRFCIRDGNPRSAGRNLFLLAELAGWPIPNVRTQSELGAVLGWSRRWTSHHLKRLRQQIARSR